MTKLNGWQRAWVVIAIVWLIPVGFFGVRTAGDYNYVWHHYHLKSTDWGDPITKEAGTFNKDAPRLAEFIYDTGLPRDQRDYQHHRREIWIQTYDVDWRFCRMGTLGRRSLSAWPKHRLGPRRF